VSAASRRLTPLVVALSLTLGAAVPALAGALRVTWEPARPRAGDVVLMRIHDVPAGAMVEATLDGHLLGTFSAATRHTAVVGVDMDAPAGLRRWEVRMTAGKAARIVSGDLVVAARTYQVQHLTVDQSMVDLDPATEKRATEEGDRLRATYRRLSGERLWRGAWLRPVAGDTPGAGFGARRVINGQARAPHSGIDFAAPVGAPVVAANRGRVALVGEYFFPGRLVVLDHGLGLYTAYFHLDTVAVAEGQTVARGETLGTVGMTGRVTGPHLHFGAQVGAARIDPAVLLELAAEE
jgi:murein DD-endopeptidase MepM/ murein hydrolase activator NlpD